jgi:hypothetical protein
VDGQVAIAHAEDTSLQRLAFLLPPRPIHALRLDPMPGPAQLRITAARLLTDQREEVLKIPLHRLRPLQQMRALEITPESVTWEIGEEEDDPFLLIDAPLLLATLDQPLDHPLSPRRLFPAVAGSLFILSLAAGAWLASWMTNGRRSHREIFLGGLAVGLLFLGLRLSRFDGMVSWAPYLDQWTGEWRTLLIPFQYATQQWQDFLAPHHEHRIVLTRTVSLALTLANGEWDNRPLVIAGLLLQMATMVVVSWVALRDISGRAGWLIAISLAVGGLAVVDWANVVVGFQIQFHGLVLCSLVALIGASQDRFSLGQAAFVGIALLVALGSMASGVLTAAVLTLACLTRAFGGHVDRRSHALTALFGGAITAVGWCARVDVSGHAWLRPESAWKFIDNFGYYASWPVPGYGLLAVALWAPWALHCVRLFQHGAASAFHRFLGWAGLWVLLQTAALAYARTYDSDGVASRYTGILLWALWLNAWALLLPFRTIVPRLRRGWMIGSAIWGVVFVGALTWQSEIAARPRLQEFRNNTRSHEERLRAYVRTGNEAYLLEAPPPELPYPHAAHLLSLLEIDRLHPLHPAPLRRERIRRAGDTALREESGWLTVASRQLLTWGPWLAGAGSLGIITLIWRRWTAG